MALIEGKQPKRLALVAAVVVVGWLAQQAGVDVGALLDGGSQRAGQSESEPSATPVRTDSRGGADSRGQTGPSASPRTNEGQGRIERALETHESGFMVTVSGSVKRTLRDDNEGSRHQRFLVEIGGGHTLLIAHNIDLAERIPISPGDPVRVHGQFEWNDRGGVLHWTHHDPDGRHEGGWIESGGRRVE